MSTQTTSASTPAQNTIQDTDSDSGEDLDMDGSQLDFHARLNEAVGSISYRKLGGLTDTHPETVRRYMQGQAPSATFLTNLCRILGVSGEWLLTGKGPMKCSQLRSYALNQADPSELMTAVANTLTDLCDRMDRIERYMQSFETRVRGATNLRQDSSNNTEMSPRPVIIDSVPSTGDGSENNHAGIGQPIKASVESKIGGQCNNSKPNSAQRIRDAIAKRPS